MTLKRMKSVVLLSSALLSIVAVTAFADDEATSSSSTIEVVNQSETSVTSTETSSSSIESAVTAIETEPSSEENQAVVAKAEDNTLPAETTPEIQTTPTTQTSEDTTPVAADEAEETGTDDVTVKQYEENVADFNAVGISDVYHMFTKDNKEHVLYIGRPTCYYCRQFSSELKEFNTLLDEGLAYYNTDSADFDDNARAFLYETVGIPGTPTILRLQNGQLLSGWVGGGVSAQQLYDYLFLGINPEESQIDDHEDNSTKDEITEERPASQDTVTFNQGQPTTMQTSPASAQSVSLSTPAPTSTVVSTKTTPTTLPNTGEEKNNLYSLKILFILLSLATLGLSKMMKSED